MIKRWAIYLSCLAVSIAICYIKGGFVSTMLFFMLLLLPIASFVMLVFSYNAFLANQEMDHRNVVKGEVVNYRYELHNTMPVVLCPMRVYFYGDQILFKDADFVKPVDYVLYPKEIMKVEFQIDCKYRGSYFVGIDRIVMRDYLNLFRLTFNEIEKLKIMVYPTIREIKKLSLHQSMNEATESVISFDKFDASLFSDVRDYMPGDPLKSIHWKLSSKYNHLITKDYEGNVNSRSKILVNTEQLPFSLEENIVLEEYVVEATVALVRYLLGNNAAVDLLWYKYDLKREFANKIKDFSRLYEVLSHMSFVPGNFLKNVIMKEMENDNEHNTYNIMTTYVDEELSRYLIQKKRQNFCINVFIIDTTNSEVAKKLEEFPIGPLNDLVSFGVHVYKIVFEKGICRLEVA